MLGLPVRLRDRLVTLGCIAAAAAVVVLGLSRGNGRAAAVGAAVVLGYAVLHRLSRGLAPARVTGTGPEAHRHRALLAALRLAGQVALAGAAVGLVLALTAGWDAGLWVAGAMLLVLAAFVLGLRLGFRRDSDRP